MIEYATGEKIVYKKDRLANVKFGVELTLGLCISPRVSAHEPSRMILEFTPDSISEFIPNPANAPTIVGTSMILSAKQNMTCIRNGTARLCEYSKRRADDPSLLWPWRLILEQLVQLRRTKKGVHLTSGLFDPFSSRI